MNALIVITFLIAVIASLAIVFRAAFKYADTTSKATSMFFGSSRLQAPASAFSLFASWMSFGNVIVGALAIVVSYRLLALWPVITWILGFFILSRHAPTIVNKTADFPTIFRFISYHFQSRRLGLFCALLAILTACGVIALELIIGSALFFSLGLDINRTLLLCIVIPSLAIVSTIYTKKGGITAVLITDRVQAYGILAGLLTFAFIAYTTPYLLGDTSPTLGEVMPAQLHSLSAPTFLPELLIFLLGWAAFQMFLLLGDLMTWQRLAICENGLTARRSAITATILTLLAWLLIFVAGLFLLNWPASHVILPQPTDNLQQHLATLAEPFTSMVNTFATNSPPILVVLGLGIITFGITSAILSTTDSFLLVATQAFLFEWHRSGKAVKRLQDLSTDPQLDHQLSRNAHRILPAIMCISLILFTTVMLAGVPLVGVIFFVFSLQCIIAPFAITALYFPSSCAPLRRKALVSAILAVALIGVLFIASASVTSLSLSYTLSYIAPLIAVLIPVATIIIFAPQMGESKPARGILIRMLGLHNNK